MTVRRFVCAGEVVVDLVMRVPRLPVRGGDVVAEAVTTEAGGATNVMVAASRLGVPTTYAGLLGTGPAGELAARALSAAGVDAPLPRRTGLDTATVVALVEPDGERTFVTGLGAEADLTDADLAAVEVGPHDVVHLSGYGLAYPSNGPCLARWLPTLPAGATVVLDLGPLVTDVPAEVLDAALARTDWLTCTAVEARALLGDRTGAADGADDLDRLAGRLRPRVRQAAVVRSGERGAAVAAYDRDPVTVPSVAVEAVDRTGAGDTHTGALVASLVHAGRGATVDAVAAVAGANAAAAFSVTHHGPATGPTTEELAAFLAAQEGSPSARQPDGWTAGPTT